MTTTPAPDGGLTTTTTPSAVVYAWPYIEWGGAQRYFFATMRRLATAGTPFVVVLPAGSDPALVDELVALGASIRYLPARLIVTHVPSVAGRIRRRLRSWLVQGWFAATCRAAAARHAVIHCDVSPFEFTLPLLILARRRGVVVTLHTGLPALRGIRRTAWRLRMAWLLRTTGFRLVAANQHVRESLRPYVPATHLASVPVALSPVEPVEIERARRWAAIDDALANVPIAPGRFLVVTGAQFIVRKGCHVLAEAARTVREAASDVDFLWLGPMALSGDAADLARNAGIQYVAQASLDGGRDDYLALVARADVFVLPSLEEGLPLALVEAMALGVAVVATPVNAVPEAVTDGESGLLVPAGDARALASAILRLRNDPDLRHHLARTGRERASRFDAGHTAEVTLRVYAEAARAGR